MKSGGSLGVAVILLTRDCQIPSMQEIHWHLPRIWRLDLSIQPSITAIPENQSGDGHLISDGHLVAYAICVLQIGWSRYAASQLLDQRLSVMTTCRISSGSRAGNIHRRMHRHHNRVSSSTRCGRGCRPRLRARNQQCPVGVDSDRM